MDGRSIYFGCGGAGEFHSLYMEQMSQYLKFLPRHSLRCTACLQTKQHNQQHRPLPLIRLIQFRVWLMHFELLPLILCVQFLTSQTSLTLVFPSVYLICPCS